MVNIILQRRVCIFEGLFSHYQSLREYIGFRSKVSYSADVVNSIKSQRDALSYLCAFEIHFTFTYVLVCHKLSCLKAKEQPFGIFFSMHLLSEVDDLRRGKCKKKQKKQQNKTKEGQQKTNISHYIRSLNCFI